MKQITIPLNNQSCDTHRERRKMCVSIGKAFCSQKFKARPRVRLFFLFVLPAGINRVLKAAFLNRTPKEKLANEAAAGGKGPRTPRPAGRLNPGPAAGSPERPF